MSLIPFLKAIVFLLDPVTRCQGAPTLGGCRMIIDGFTFDTKLKVCKEFFGGGCRFSQNGFRNKKECEAKCGTFEICFNKIRL